MALWSKKENSTQGYICSGCTEKYAGIKVLSDLQLKPTTHQCHYPIETYAEHESIWACECPTCGRQNTALAELNELLEGLDEVTRGKRCPVCETSIHNCTCEDAKCASCGDFFQKDFERCSVFPNFHALECCEEASDDHPHLYCTHNEHLPDGKVVEGGWYDCGHIRDGLCEDHEMCADHCPIQNGEEEDSYGCDHSWKVIDDLPHQEGEYSACAACRHCGTHGHVTINTNDFEVD